MDKLDKLKIVLERALEKQKRTEDEYDDLLEQKAEVEYKLKQNVKQQSIDYKEVANAESVVYEYENLKLEEK